MNEMIEEMASDMNYGCVKHDLYPDDAKEIARALVILGYRRITEDSVVLTREEYDEFLRQGAMIDFLKECNKEARKETAKEIIKLIDEIEKNNPNGWIGALHIKQAIAKQCGVEE